MTRLAQRPAASRLHVHRHDRTEADEFAVARIDPIGVERLCALVEPSEHFRRVVVRELDSMRVAIDKLESGGEGHAQHANGSVRLIEPFVYTPAEVGEQYGAARPAPSADPQARRAS